MYHVFIAQGIKGLFIGLPATLFGISCFASMKLTFFQIVRNHLSTILPFENRFKGIYVSIIICIQILKIYFTAH
jgi:hypothetical protein